LAARQTLSIIIGRPCSDVNRSPYISQLPEETALFSSHADSISYHQTRPDSCLNSRDILRQAVDLM